MKQRRIKNKPRLLEYRREYERNHREEKSIRRKKYATIHDKTEHYCNSV